MFINLLEQKRSQLALGEALFLKVTILILSALFD